MRYKSENGIQVLARAAAILRICKDAPGGLSLGAIAQAVALPRSTVQRIVAALAVEGLLLAGSAASGIRLGPQIHALAEGTRFDVVEIAHPHLKRLSEATGETVDLALLRHDHMVFVDQIVGSQRLRAVSAVGESFPLHCTANGKAALALLEDAAIARHCAAGLPRFTPATHVTLRAVRKDLANVRKTGLATDREEHSAGISALGMAFRDLGGAIYAISIPMPSVRFEERAAEFGLALRSASHDLLADITNQRATPGITQR
jgi:DNA-binding IclR family transcriptional regulator